ncbi:MAG: hypothetical protein ACO3E4_07540, partial [Candidatus Nanopelagicaceae bacterium]
GAASPARGKFYRAQVRNGIDGTVAFDANFETAMTSQTVGSFTESSTNAATVTVNRTTYNFQLDTLNNLGTAGALLPTTLGSSTAADSNDPRFLDHTGTNYVYLPGVASNLMTVPNSAALNITGDIDLRAYIAPDSWTPAAQQTIIAKYTTAGNNRSFMLRLNTNGTLNFIFSSDGIGNSNQNSTVATGFSAGQAYWVRATLDVDNGASGNDFKFFTSINGTTWTQLGSTITIAGTTSIFAGTSIVEIGVLGSSTGPFAGKLFRAQIYDGIDGTKVLDVDTSVITAGSATSFTAVTGQTVTINRSTSGRKTVAVTQPLWLLGTDDYMEVNNRYMASGTYLYLPGISQNYASTPDAAALDISADMDLRCKVAFSDWTPSVSQAMIRKGQSASTLTYSFSNYDGFLEFQVSTNGTAWATNVASSVRVPFTDGQTGWVRATFDADNGSSQNEVKFWTSTDGTNWTQLGITRTQAGTISVFNSTAIVEVGSANAGTAANTIPRSFFQAQILDGIDGTVAFDANFETSITSLLQTTFT